MQREYAYSVVDVFAERALQGNPLAVFHDARGLSDSEMQALARETNLAETTFILPSDNERDGVRVRIFTTQEELPFAGHPTLGTASWLRWNYPRLAGAPSITLRLNAGPITVTFEDEENAGPDGAVRANSAARAGMRGRMQQADPKFGSTHARSAVAAALGLAVEDLATEYAPQTVSTGMPFCIVLLASMEAIARLQISQRDAQRYLENSDAKFFYCVASTGKAAPAAEFQARMQFYGGEDPATGSAAGCCIAWLVAQGLVASQTPAVIEQGVAIQRPSRITVQASRAADGQVREVFVGGRTIPVARGSFFLPALS
jgi:trans-2,3-dihydro-3-hydroxyanthranilate isomerase